jgi:signal transduction histidine kinase
VSYIFIASLPLLFTSTFLVGTAQDSIQETILDRNLQFTERSTRFIDLKIKTAKELLKNQAQHLALDWQEMGNVELAINTMVQQFDVFDEVSVIDTLGKVRSSTSFDDRGPERFGSNGWVATTLGGLSYQSEVFIGEGRIPKLILGEPISLHTEIIGILGAVVDLQVMWDLVKENALGLQGEAFVFDQEGVYIAHSDPRKVHSEERFTNSVILQRIARGESDRALYVTDAGAEMVAAYAPIGRYGWGAMMQQPTSEAFAPARRMRTSILQIMFVTVFLASLLAYFYSRWIVRPVDHLVTGIDRFSEGDLSHRVQKVSDDEIGTLAEHFNEMADKLSEYQNTIKRTERLETLGKLASVLSHEIRNPLNSMVINMQILKREISKAEMNKLRVEKFYGILAAEIKRVDQLVTDFLLVARPPKLEKTEVAINEILDEVLLTQVADSLKKGVRIERNYSSDAPVIADIDVDKMRQVVLNLIINAIQAMPGGGKLTISLSEAMSGDHTPAAARNAAVKISFTDTGFGIKEEDRSKVFDFYYSTKADGSGLGLAIVQQIVEMHHGRIKVDSQVDVGTTFTIDLPSTNRRKE